MLYLGRIIEIEAICKISHSKLPTAYREWRNLTRFSEDVYLGLWLAWLIWLRTPSMVPQGIGAVARSGITGAITSPLILIGFAIFAGIAVLALRVIASLPGQFSRILGLLSVGIRPRGWGLAVTAMGIWVLTSILVGPIMSSI
jgi:hypothetical protein